jgi:adenosylhomocysteine nucleosidase
MSRDSAFLFLLSDFLMSVAVVFALGAEQGCFEDRLADVTTVQASAGTVRTGRLLGRTVTTIVSGVGPLKAAAACEALLLGHRPRVVISAGFCGGLQPHLRRDAVVVADRILMPDGRTQLIDAAFRETLRLPTGCVGPWLTVERIVTRSAEKRALGERTGAWACEMESSAVADACAARSVSFLAVRAVSDTVDDDLPDDLEPLMNARTTAGTLGAVVGTLWRRPASIKDLLKLKEHALTAAEALAKFLADVIAQLPEDAGDATLPTGKDALR